MNFKFNTAHLSRPQQESLMAVLGVLRDKNKNELEVNPVEFPNKFVLKLDDGVRVLLGWDCEKNIYTGFAAPETVPESKRDTVDLPSEPEP